jgi:protein-tyrosine phosphatase
MFFIKRSSDVEDKINYEDLDIVDFHSHILPKFDDGSGSVEESLEMLSISAAQGVKKIVATPHFYPGSLDPDRFIEKRAHSAQMLLDAISKKKQQGIKFPDIYLGAEVSYFNGMSRYKGLDRFCINGTRLLLVEMPFEKWTENDVYELLAVKNELGLIPVMAHIERYIAKQSKALFPMIFSGDILVQSNADAFLERKTKRLMLNMLLQGNVDVLGSDCHNLTDRMPNISKALNEIVQRCGEDPIYDLMHFSNYVLEEAIPLK